MFVPEVAFFCQTLAPSSTLTCRIVTRAFSFTSVEVIKVFEDTERRLIGDIVDIVAGPEGEVVKFIDPMDDEKVFDDSS